VRRHSTAPLLLLTLLAAPARADEAPRAAAAVRPPLFSAAYAAVAAGHPEAAEIGAAVLRDGGNAMDAAVAVSLALGVAEPYGSGLGGRIVILYREASSGAVRALHGIEAASLSLDVEAFRRLPVAARSEGATSVCVPGLPAALHAAHRRWGTKPWPGLVAPAITLARQGSLVLPLTVTFFAAQEEKLRRHAEARRLYLPGDRPPVAGTRLANPELAATLERFANEGPAGFYEGTVAAAIVAAVRAGGGTLTLEDMARYAPVESEPVAFSFHDYRIFSSPPPLSGGAILELTLRALDGVAWPAPVLRDPASLDLFGRTLRQVYPEVQAAIGDVPDLRERYRVLTTPESVARIRSRAATAVTGQPDALAPRVPEEDAAGSTTHFVVVDAAGNVASVTQSTGYHFGSGIVAPGTGVSLNNWMNSLTYSDPDSVNFVAPGKRGRSTTTPTLVLRDGRPLLALGVPGGQRIPSGVAQVLLDVLVLGRTPDAAIGDVRFHLERPSSPRAPANLFEFESSVPATLLEQLRERGWQAEAVTDVEHFGGVNAVEWTRDGLRCWADPRRTNACAGY
jgi:gamma-glutamyltranspeptidase/glutathione hydrolase